MANVPGINDLFTALQMFQTGAQQLGVARAINRANQQVQQIRESQLAEADQMDQIRRIAGNLQSGLVGAGASASGAQLAGQGILTQSPEPSMQTGPSPFEQQQQLLQQKQRFEQQQAREKFQQEKELVRLKNEQQGTKLKPLSTGEIGKIQALDEQLLNAESLLAAVSNNPSLVSPYQRIPGVAAGRQVIESLSPNPQFTQFKAEVDRFFDQYRHAITGAQAGEKEIEMLLSRTPQVSDSPEQFKAKIKSLIAQGRRIRQKQIQNFQSAGRDIESFQQTPGTVDVSSQASPQGNGITIQPSLSVESLGKARQFFKPGVK